MIKNFEKPMKYSAYLGYLLPSVLTMIFLSFYTTIDGFFVSRFAGSDALAGINIVIPITCVIFGVAVMLATGSGAIIGELLGKKYFGEDGVAAVTIIMYIYYFFISFYMGVAVATAPVVSYNVGSRNHQKIIETLKHSFLTIGISSFVIVAISLLEGQAIIGLFVQNGNVFDITWNGLKLFSPVFLFIGVNVFLSGYFTALGNGLVSAIISSLRSLLLVIVFIIALPPIVGVSGIWLTMPLSEAATIIIAIQLYRKRGRVTPELQQSN